MDEQKTFTNLVEIVRENDDGDEERFVFPEPSSYTATTSTMVDSGTSVSGHLLGAVVRENVAHISLSWKYLSIDQWKAINSYFEDYGSGNHYINTVNFLNQTTGTWEKRKMYVSDRSAGLWQRNKEGDVVGWLDCSLEFSEV